MTPVSTSIQSFLQQTPPFDRLSKVALEQLTNRLGQLRYRMGQAIVIGSDVPAHISILYEGQVRVIGNSAQTKLPETLQRLGPGIIIGWQSILRDVPCETVIASTESMCLTLPGREFQQLLKSEPNFAAAFHEQCGMNELYDLLFQEIAQQPIANVHLLSLVQDVLPETIAFTVPKGKLNIDQLDTGRIWFVSSGQTNYAVGSRLTIADAPLVIESNHARLIGMPKPEEVIPQVAVEVVSDHDEPTPTIPYAPDRPERREPDDATLKRGRYPLVRAKGELESALACFQMLSQLWKMPFRRDVLRRALVNQKQRTGSVSLQFCGAIAELMGLTAQLATIPADALTKLQTPVMVYWQEHFVLLYHVSEKTVILASPDRGLVRIKPSAFTDWWEEEGEVLLLQPTRDTPQSKFGLSWFIPSVIQYRRVLITVLIASFFVQLLGLANPLITQVIIDKVIIQNAAETLNILGGLLVGMAVLEGIIGTLRMNLFVDTTNRIDMKLGSEVIDHLLRLPLNYFEKRPVGELSTRINELENIRQFLTGTALTVVLDAVFSVIYIVVMIFYSPLLTIVALSTIPLFGLLTLTVSPILRAQARLKAERNAEQQSYLVEVVSGVQTVKAQNIELQITHRIWRRPYRLVPAIAPLTH